MPRFLMPVRARSAQSQSTISRRRPLVAGAILLACLSLAGAGTLPRASAATPIRVGAVFPLKSIGMLAQEEYRGVQIAAAMVNASGGVGGRPIRLVTRELDSPDQASAVMNGLHRQGIAAVLGAYASALSIPASQAAARDGMVYWEAGAEADRLTGRGLPLVFRVGASGSDLGTNSARFAATQLASRLGKRPNQLRISLVSAQDAYAESVADAVVREAGKDGLKVATWSRYDPAAPLWAPVMRTVQRAHPDILILASHIPDGIAFRRAMLAAHVHVGAFIGSTMAQCEPDFGNALGRDAIGVFASDRPSPMGGFNPATLSPAVRALYNRFAAAWRKVTRSSRPTEEGLAGFSAAWVLFHDVLPRTARSGKLTPTRIAATARSLNLPSGSLPNGAGVRFATDRAHLGQNLRAAAVIWQWQGVRHSVIVWPRLYASGHIKLVPLPR